MNYRCDDVKNSYVNTGFWKQDSDTFKIGTQMLYEWQKDFQAMKFTLNRLHEFLEVANEKGYFTGTLNIAYNDLLNRVSEYSCPSNLKEHLRTKENCLLKDKCKCSQPVSDK